MATATPLISNLVGEGFFYGFYLKIQASWYGFAPSPSAIFVSPKLGNNQLLFNQQRS